MTLTDLTSTMAGDEETGDGRRLPNDKRTSKGFHRVRAKERIGHLTWTWFASTMSTGSLAAIIGQTPYRFIGLNTIGKVFFIIDLVLFSVLIGLISLRFAMKPIVALRSLHHPSEALFFGSFWVSISLILTCTQIYGVPSSGPWLVTALNVCFWVYAACAFSVGVFQYATLFVEERLPVSSAMPAWVFPAYPFLVIGPLAAVMLPSQPRDSAIAIFIGAVMLQGLGWTLSIFMYTIYIQRLMSSKLPAPSRRPAMYISVGPVGYTSAAMVALGTQAPNVVPANFLSTSIDVGQTIKVLGIMGGIFLWAVAFWFFCLSTVLVLQGIRQMSFTLSWWAFIFPNAGMALALIQISKALNNSALKAVCSAMTVVLVVLWLFVTVANIVAVFRKQILWKGKDEDAGMDLRPHEEKQ